MKGFKKVAQKGQGTGSFEIMLVVLFTAFLHASRNAFINWGDNKLVNSNHLVTVRLPGEPEAGLRVKERDIALRASKNQGGGPDSKTSSR